MRILAFAGLAGLICLAGCRSPYVEADVINATAAPVSLVEVDYPSASFGVGSLAAGATFHYRFKILGSGATKVLWTDTERHDHSVAGPPLHEGQEGTLSVTISGGTAQWNVQLR
jgi:hypothetical protein